MAIDTRDKRASVLGFGLAALVVLPAPGTIDQPDRQHLAYCYRGIQAGVAQIAVGIQIIVAAEDRTITIVEDRTIIIPEIGS